ncbi:MAG TPA: LuxR C-terminal-related transcriptional regulator [Sinomonas sp.]|jgi:DNA-binding CsgD family transcriptional regulator|nr:LuxR C-terminal-related transcriptional regulator [Sinomonas sp.]
MEPAENLAAQLMGLPTRQEYMQAASEMLAKLFPGLGVGWASLDAQSGEVEVINYPDVPSVSREVFVRFYEEHPLIRGYMVHEQAEWDILRLSDLISDRALRETPVYREALRLAGVDRQFSIRLSVPGDAGLSAWALVRNGQDFSDAELELAASVQPVLRLLNMAYPRNMAYSRIDEAETQNDPDAFDLTAREQEILHLIGHGLTAVAIGHLLGVSPRTVAKHLEHAYTKLGCTNRVDALNRLRGIEAADHLQHV